MKQCRIIVLLALASLYASTASAQYISSGGGGGGVVTPQGTFNEQSLTTFRRDISVYLGPFANPKFGTLGDAGLAITRPGNGSTFAGLEAGMAYGLAKGLEAGFFLPTLELAPEADIGGGLPLFITWAASVQDVDFGLRNTVTIPIDGGVTQWNPGLHGLVRFDSGRFDFGAFFPMVFNEPVAVGLDIPIRLAMGFEDVVFITVQTGLRKGDIINGENDLFMPLGFGLLYSAEVGDHRLDIGGRFEWPGFLWATAPEGSPDIVFENNYTIWFGLNAHFDVGS